MRLASLPQGFLDLLGVAREGRTLSESADYLQCVLDTTWQYLATDSRVDGSGQAVGAGFTSFATVPIGEIWVLHSASIDIDQPVGESGQACLAEQSPNNPGNTRVLLTPFIGSLTAAAVTARREAASWASRPGYFLVSGAQLGSFSTAAPSGGTGVRCGFKTTRFRA